ncbi:hypothetical protein CFC21_001235 [Triticum aestivum]|uniref:F-box domain-containing protein n=2 Tax=Triticum TaxID=4564 RepID=A0A3B5XXM6_WHEAT|nr:hypothetical protein CFC21_001235 [Triticum aestivum]
METPIAVDHVNLVKNMEAPAATLPDDVILEILVRLAEEASLFRCAATCKLWRCLIADSSFLRRRWPANSRHPSSLVGFLANKCHIHQGIMGLPMGPAAAQTFVPVPGPQPVFGRGRRSLGSLLPQAGTLFDRVTPLASHGGLLLVRFVPTHHASRPTVVHLAMCNLLAGTCEALPPLEYKSCDNNDRLDGFGVLTGADFCSTRPPLPGFSVLFRVLLIGASPDGRHYHLYTFSSDEPSWSAPTACLDRCLPERRTAYLLMQNDAAVQRGAAHWLCWDFSDVYDFAVDAEIGEASLAKLPFPVATRFFLAPYHARQLRVGADGSLLFLRLHVQGLWMEIWTRQDSGTASSWLCTHLIEIEPPKADGVVDCICFGEKSGTVLLADQNWSSSYLVNIETGRVLEEMTERGILSFLFFLLRRALVVEACSPLDGISVEDDLVCGMERKKGAKDNEESSKGNSNTNA